jgi:hypothetical protein
MSSFSGINSQRPRTSPAGKPARRKRTGQSAALLSIGTTVNFYFEFADVNHRIQLSKERYCLRGENEESAPSPQSRRRSDAA